jgi:hypothetical protein
MPVAEPLSYRRPMKKLLRFSERSRNQWKSKCQTAKQENKSLKIRLAKVKVSRDRWKAKALSAEESSTVDSSPELETKKVSRQSSRGHRAGVA